MVMKVVHTGLSPDDHYEALDAQLTAVLSASGAVVGDEALRLLVAYNRRLRIAVGLPVEVPT